MQDILNLIKNISFEFTEYAGCEVASDWSKYSVFYSEDRIYYIEAGEAEMYMHNKVLKLRPNHMYYIPGDSILKTYCEKSLLHYFVHFNMSREVKSILRSIDMVNEIPATQDDFELMYQKIIRVYFFNRKPTVAESLAANGAMQILLAKFIQDTNLQDNNVTRISNALKYIDEHISEQISVQYLAESQNISTIYFSKLFGEKMGVSPKQYILNKKIGAAIALMSDDKISISEIAYKVGFDDNLYFSRIFKEKMGESPYKYRKYLFRKQF